MHPSLYPMLAAMILLSACATPSSDDPSAGGTPDSAYPPAGFIALTDLGCDTRNCGDMVTDAMGILPLALARLNRQYPDANAYVGLLSAEQADPDLLLDPPIAAELFAGQDFLPAPDGRYVIDSFAVDSPGCAISEISHHNTAGGDETSGNGDRSSGDNGGDDGGGEPRDGLPGGICGTLAIAHSLVYRLTVVKRDWSGVIDGDHWSDKFLKAIYRATGDGDGNRDIDRDEIDSAHEADWNKRWDIDKSRDWDKKPEAGNCEQLKTWCKRLERYRESEGDDCIIHLRRPTSGHYLTPETVTWDEAACHCVVEAPNTGEQDGSGADFKNVPKAPGKQTWKFGPNEEIEVTDGPSKNFFNRRYRDAWFACYDEDPVAGQNQDRRGSALPE